MITGSIIADTQGAHGTCTRRHECVTVARMTDDVTPAQLRAKAEERLAPLGQRRIELLADLEAVEAELRPVVLDAVRVEVSFRRINALTALSTTTVGKWVRQAEE